MPSPHTREHLITRLASPLATNPLFRAAWLGGSDASGRADEHSDLDLMVIVEAGRDDEAIDAVESILASIAPITGRYRLPGPTWHGHEQVFWSIDGYAMAGLIDLVILHPGEQARWLVTERHADARILFDHDDLIHPAPLNRADLARTLDHRIADLSARVPILAPLALKEARRGRDLDALNFYHALVLRPLVELLRIVHCPERWDYAMRYLDRDLPPEVHAQLRTLAFVSSCADIERNYPIAMDLIGAALKQLRPDDIS